MADYDSVSSPTNKLTTTSSSDIFTSPRCFNSKGSNETDYMMTSPTSILDTKPFSTCLKTPFWPNTPTTSPKTSSRGGVSLGLVEALIDETSSPKSPQPESRMLLFGAHPKLQIPPTFQSASDSPMSSSPGDFGIKTRMLSPSNKSSFGLERVHSPGILSAGEMELSEEYTCVITRGPNPKTTHIFDDCVIESCCGVVENFASSKKGNNGFAATDQSLSYPYESLLSSCYNCKKNLDQGRDIYMYRLARVSNRLL